MMPQGNDLFDFFVDDREMFEKYKEWDARNPQFYPLFCRFANQLIERGHSNIGVALLFERIRWESMIKTDGEPFKLNNNYKSIYARRFMRDFPEHEGCFRLRELKHDIDMEEA
jgi:hypothetical protein